MALSAVFWHGVWELVRPAPPLVAANAPWRPWSTRTLAVEVRAAAVAQMLTTAWIVKIMLKSPVFQTTSAKTAFHQKPAKSRLPAATASTKAVIAPPCFLQYHQLIQGLFAVFLLL
jgi:hypothetical protein